MRAVVNLDPAASAEIIAGRSVSAHLAAHLRAAGYEVAVSADPGESVLVVTGPWIGVLPESWARVREPGSALVGPDGAILGAVGPDREGGARWPVSAEEAVHPSTTGGRAALARTLGRRQVAAWERSGVYVVDPARLTVDVSVIVEPGAVLWPDLVLRGATIVRAGAEVRPGCWVEDTEVDEGAVIKPNCVLEGARVGPRCHVGPMAHLRPGSVLIADNKVGNFVEVKSATLRRGAKASHLTYLGDAEIGEDANIGAGTITCNYDGHRKHKTSIGARAFIGSNTALVAPIRVGDGAIVGAGSTLTRDVLPDALVVVRGEERTLPGKGKALNERNARLAAAEKAKAP